MSLWLADRPLVLASQSVARRTLLQAADVPHEACPAAIDERAIETGLLTRDPAEIARALAAAKALDVSAGLPGRLVLGADQTLDLDGHTFSKPADRAAARRQLLALRGRTHALHSALCLACDGQAIFDHVESARLTMRDFSERFLDLYLESAGDAVTGSVGAYQLEGRGIHLFATVEGDHSTILGLPLLALLTALRRLGYLAA